MPMLVYQRLGEAELRTSEPTITIRAASELLLRLAAEIPENAKLASIALNRPNEGDFIEVRWECR